MPNIIQQITPNPTALAEELEPVWIFMTDEDWLLIRDAYLINARDVGVLTIRLEHILINAMARQLGSAAIARRVLYSGKIISYGFMIAASTPALEGVRTPLTIFSWTIPIILPAVATGTGWMLRQFYPWASTLSGWARLNIALKSNALAAAAGVAPRAANGRFLPIAVYGLRTAGPFAADALLTALSKIPIGTRTFAQLISTTAGRAVALEIVAAFLKEAVSVTAARILPALRIAGGVTLRALGATFGTIFRALPVAGNILLFIDSFGAVIAAFQGAQAADLVREIETITPQTPFQDYLTARLTALLWETKPADVFPLITNNLAGLRIAYAKASQRVNQYIRYPNRDLISNGVLRQWEQEVFDAILQAIQVPIIPEPPIEAPAPVPPTWRLPPEFFNPVPNPYLALTAPALPSTPPIGGGLATVPPLVLDLPLPQTRPVVINPRTTLPKFQVIKKSGLFVLVVDGAVIRAYPTAKEATRNGTTIINQIALCIQRSSFAQSATEIAGDIISAWVDPLAPFYFRNGVLVSY